MCLFCDFLIFDQKSVIFGCFYPFSISDGVVTQSMLLINIRTWIYNQFGQSLKLLGRVVTLEVAIFTPILINLTSENRSKMNVNYKMLGLLPYFRILQLLHFKTTTIKMVKKLKYWVEM